MLTTCFINNKEGAVFAAGAAPISGNIIFAKRLLCFKTAYQTSLRLSLGAPDSITLLKDTVASHQAGIPHRCVPLCQRPLPSLTV